MPRPKDCHGIPPDKVIVVQKDGKTYYVFPDAARRTRKVIDLLGSNGPEQFVRLKLLGKEMSQLSCRSECANLAPG